VATPPARFLAPAAAAVAIFLGLVVRSARAADDLPPGAVRRFQDPRSGPVLDVAVSPDGATVAAATARSDVQLWRFADGKLARTLRAETPATSIQFSPDGSRLVAAHSDGSVRLWDPRDGTMVKRLMVHPRATRVVALSEDGRTLAGGGADGAVYLVDAETGNPIRRLLPEPPDPAAARGIGPGLMRALAFSPDGGTLVSTHDRFDLFLHVWDVKSGREVTRLRGEGNGAVAAVFSADGATLATADEGGQDIKLWETATWRLRRRLHVLGMAEMPFAFTADGRSLWSAAGSELLQWDLAAGRILRKHIAEHRSEITAAATFPDTKIVSACDDGTVIIWTGADTTQPAKDPADIHPEGLWGALAAEDASVAYEAMWALASAPEQAVPYLRNRLPRRDTADAGRIGKLLKDLDDDRYAVRERAMKELAELGDSAEPILREQLATSTSPEVRQRVEVLLESVQQTVGDADAVRALRAVEVLERIGNPAARGALDELATGTSGAKLKARAQAALRRLDRSTKRPD
jgi:dipeptidyl aminopeptidase/acylaminoacyl peptidase